MISNRFYLKMAELEPVNDVAPLSHLRQAEQVFAFGIRTRSAVLKYAPSLSLTGYYGPTISAGS